MHVPVCVCSYGVCGCLALVAAVCACAAVRKCTFAGACVFVNTQADRPPPVTTLATRSIYWHNLYNNGKYEIDYAQRGDMDAFVHSLLAEFYPDEPPRHILSYGFIVSPANGKESQVRVREWASTYAGGLVVRGTEGRVCVCVSCAEGRVWVGSGGWLDGWLRGDVARWWAHVCVYHYFLNARVRLVLWVLVVSVLLSLQCCEGSIARCPPTACIYLLLFCMTLSPPPVIGFYWILRACMRDCGCVLMDRAGTWTTP
jgi:hypothetical protein